MTAKEKAVVSNAMMECLAWMEPTIAREFLDSRAYIELKSILVEDSD